jgi:hypothetical protein
VILQLKKEKSQLPCYLLFPEPAFTPASAYLIIVLTTIYPGMPALTFLKRLSLFNNSPRAAVYSPADEKGFYKFLLETRDSYSGFNVTIAVNLTYPFNHKPQLQQSGWYKIIIKPTLNSSSLFNLQHKTDPNFLKQFRSRLAEKRALVTVPGNIVKIINVRETSLVETLDSNIPHGQTIDFLSLDTAKLNHSMLKAITRSKYVPLFIIVNQDLNITADSRVYNFLIKMNYSLFAQTPVASIFRLKTR